MDGYGSDIGEAARDESTLASRTVAMKHGGDGRERGADEGEPVPARCTCWRRRRPARQRRKEWRLSAIVAADSSLCHSARRSYSAWFPSAQAGRRICSVCPLQNTVLYGRMSLFIYISTEKFYSGVRKPIYSGVFRNR
jgi:hypothetical protein